MGENLAADETGDPTSISATLLLDYALDEAEQAHALLRICHGALTRGKGSTRRKPLLLSALVGTRSAHDVSEQMGGQYFGENLDRARACWRRAIEHFEQLFVYHGHRERVSRLHNELTLAGLFTVLADLQQQAVPAGRKASAAHMGDVLRRIDKCTSAGVQARTLMMLRDERSEQR